ncbi:MAG: N-acetyl-gamma-glutamyl-phosphate reductase [Deltaproteobacteria bacterium]|nr:N-acetyl-gamma-glutamyl-phosphate reductase [Deltaproteobacteria bacterium]
MSAAVRTAIIGGTGYSGVELTRLILQHPHTELVLVTSPSGEGRPLADHQPILRGLTQLPLSPVPQAASEWPAVDLIFLCLPHGVSRDLVPSLPPTARVIDLSGDFRIRDGETFAKYYGISPPAPEWQRRFVYGLPEVVDRAEIAHAHYVANPGCFATAVTLGLAPLVRLGLIESRVIVDAKTGSTGAGAKPSVTTQHATRANSFYGYKSFAHQHVPEIKQTLATLSRGWGDGLVFQAHSTPLVRGIFASIYCRVQPGVSAASIDKAFRDYYEGCAFMRLCEGSPNVNWTRGSNFVDLGWSQEDRELIVFCALDNLGKGAAGQAVQNMNLMYGYAEMTGLWQAGGVP